MAHNPTDYDAVLQDYYTEDKIKEQTFSENPLYAMMPKEQAGGKKYVQPVRYGHPGGASAVYGTAKTNSNKSKSKYEDFLITRKKQYQNVTIDNELLYATESPRASFKKAFDEFDDGFRGLGEKIGRRLYRTSGGAIGKMNNSTVSTTTITLLDKASAFNFEQGQQLQFAAADGTGSLRDSGDVTEVTAIDYEEGTITVADTLNVKIAAIAVGDYIFQEGDFGECISGIEDWIPVDDRTTKLAASFHSVTRTPNPVRLGGVYMDGTAMGGLDEVLIKLVGKIGKHGGNTSHIYANPETLTDLQLSSNAKMLLPQEIYTTMKSSSGEVIVGFAGYKVQIGSRTVRVYGDRNCPSNRIHALQMNTWKIYHAGKSINWLGEEWTGTKLTRHPTEDAMFADLGAYMNVGCSAPAWNGTAKITPHT